MLKAVLKWVGLFVIGAVVEAVSRGEFATGVITVLVMALFVPYASIPRQVRRQVGRRIRTT
jgi:hypothetical protein